MGIEIKWTIDIPETGERHWILAEKFAGTWHFKRRRFRRDVWVRFNNPTREMWEHILEQLHKRYRRREGVSEEDIAHVTKILRELPVPRDLQQEPPPHPEANLGSLAVPDSASAALSQSQCHREEANLGPQPVPDSVPNPHGDS